jgi:colanic acid biosynthesis glycosyl transferase WcaI
MAAGKPILMAVDGEAGEFIELNCCGKKARAGDASSICDTILQFIQMRPNKLEELGNNAREAFEKYFSSEPQINLWEALFKQLTGEVKNKSV